MQSDDELDDLMKRVQAGDLDAIREILDRYGSTPEFRRLAIGMIDDLLTRGDTFSKAALPSLAEALGHMVHDPDAEISEGAKRLLAKLKAKLN